MGARLQGAGGHHAERINELARVARVTGKPAEIGNLLSTTWFTPIKDAPPAAKPAKQALAEVAPAVCRGASVYLALKRDKESVTFTVRPDPVATVVLERRQHGRRFPGLR